jgi:hypothetical protein
MCLNRLVKSGFIHCNAFLEDQIGKKDRQAAGALVPAFEGRLLKHAFLEYWAQILGRFASIRVTCASHDGAAGGSGPRRHSSDLRSGPLQGSKFTWV